MKEEKTEIVLAGIAIKPLEQNYDRYFQADLYNKRFGNKKTATSEENLVKKVYSASAEVNKKDWEGHFKIIRRDILLQAENETVLPKFTLLDFGCGDGRLLPVILGLADELAQKGVEMRVIGYDISKVGLENYRDVLKSCGFIEEEAKDNQANLANLTRKNLEIKLVHGNENKRDLKDLVGSVTACICMFGVLSHISKRENRQNILRDLNEITSGYLAISVAGRGNFKREQLGFEIMREIRGSSSDSEDGDILYGVKDSDLDGEEKIVNFYHLYTVEELQEDLAAAGFTDFKTQSLSISKPQTLSKSSFLDQFDNFIAQAITAILPNSVATNISSYLGAITKGDKKPGSVTRESSASPASSSTTEMLK